MRGTYAAIWSPEYGVTPDPYHRWARARGTIELRYTDGVLARVIAYDRTPKRATALLEDELRANQISWVPDDLEVSDLDVAV